MALRRYKSAGAVPDAATPDVETIDPSGVVDFIQQQIAHQAQQQPIGGDYTRMLEREALVEAGRAHASGGAVPDHAAPTPAPAPAEDHLQQQIADLKRAEQALREQLARQAGARPEAMATPSAVDHIAAMPISAHKKAFLRANPEFLDPAKGLAFFHQQALSRGVADDTEEMNQAILRGVHGEAQRERINSALEPPPAPPRTDRSIPMSAPVSRTIPSVSTGRTAPTRVTLSPEQRESARISGISEFDYAKNLQRLEREKQLGMHAERN
ncbi:MAG TPA: hypothetical protein VIY51_20705 [Xanthobacteraceae bacterium]